MTNSHINITDLFVPEGEHLTMLMMFINDAYCSINNLIINGFIATEENYESLSTGIIYS